MFIKLNLNGGHWNKIFRENAQFQRTLLAGDKMSLWLTKSQKHHEGAAFWG